MPRFQPAARPTFSCSITRASGSCSRTTSALPSLEPLSTTITSSPRTLSRQRSIQGSALCVTTTTLASGMARARPPAQTLPEQDQPAGQRHHDGDEEEEEAGGEGLVRVDADVAEEADEERLPDGEAVERERDEQDEEEERPHHVVDPRRELDPHRAGGRPDRENSHGLDRDREEEERDQEPRPVAERVDAVVDRADGTLQPERTQQRRR